MELEAYINTASAAGNSASQSRVCTVAVNEIHMSAGARQTCPIKTPLTQSKSAHPQPVAHRRNDQVDVGVLRSQLITAPNLYDRKRSRLRQYQDIILLYVTSNG